jgi:UDP-glucose 4-epimerase
MTEQEKTIIVTGGSGFIGTALCKLLVEAGHNVINIDRKKKDIEGVTLYPFDIDNHQVKGIIQLVRPDAIIHLAADHEVGRSMVDPGIYYANNVANTINLLNCAVEAGVKEFIYSSSSSVYGDTDVVPTPEKHPREPQSPYARTKHMVEQILEDYRKAYDFNYVSLRYFNAAGAIPDMSHGYTQDPATHLVPILCRKAISGETLTINGSDYDSTADGTAARDYTHVCDIASAHLAALNYLHDTESSDVFNIGAGGSTTVLEMVAALADCDVTETALTTVLGPRRDGDVAQTCADVTKAKELLGWEAQYSLNDILEHAYAWEMKNTKRKKS